MFWVWNRNGHWTYFGHFPRWAYVQPYHSKGLGESFPLMWLNIALSLKIRRPCVFWLFFKIDLCSAISFKRFRRELSIDVAEHRFTSKNFQNAHYRRFGFIPKTCLKFPKTEVLFLRSVFNRFIYFFKSNFKNPPKKSKQSNSQCIWLRHEGRDPLKTKASLTT